jgi:hypothetical protein
VKKFAAVSVYPTKYGLPQAVQIGQSRAKATDISHGLDIEHRAETRD